MPTDDREDADIVVSRSDLSDIRTSLTHLIEDVSSVKVAKRSLTTLGEVVGDLASSIQGALVAQTEAEESRIREIEKAETDREVAERRNVRRFWIMMSVIGLANVIVVCISLVILITQVNARAESDIRSATNRDRQQCATSLLVEFNTRFGEAIQVSTQFPRGSNEYNTAVAHLNQATELMNQAPTLCYGDNPNPNPLRR